jgi:hypothetical protein
MADKAAIFDSSTAHFREVGKADSSGLAIDVHIISPGWGSSGYYSDTVLTEACKKRVYPEGMHMHWDHPTRQQEEDQPARTLKDFVGVLTEDGHYDPNGWDGPGVYAKAKIFPEWVDKIKAMDGHIGISHYVSGTAEAGEAPDGKKGRIIKELIADALNTVDFVTVPGAGGHYRTLFTEMKVGRTNPTANDRQKEDTMGDNQESLTLSEVRTKYPEIVTELKEQLKVELKTEEAAKDQSAKLAEAADRIKTLEAKLAEQTAKIAEAKAGEYVKAEIGKAKLPEASGKLLTATLLKAVPLTEDGEIDAPKFAEIVKEAITAKTEEIAAIVKEAGGIQGNGGGAPPAGDSHKELVEAFEANYRAMGKTQEQAKHLAEIAAGGR